jgi:TP901 family phage tail tape measure protein
MANVGSVDIQIKLAREQLAKDIADLQRLLKSLPDVNLNTDPAKAGLAEVEKSATALQVTLGGLSATAGIALSAIADKAKNVAIAFDSARAKASTLSDDSVGLGKSLRDLSADLKYQANSTDLLNSTYDILSAGYSKTADVTNILKNATLAATGGFSNVNTVAGATTTILNSYGKSVDQAAHVTDVLIATQNAGKITVAQYAGLIGEAATTAAAAGVSIEEFSAYVATATGKGVQASSAVAGVRAAITALLSPSESASKLAQELGVQFNAAALKSKGLTGVLADLNAKGAATPQVLTELFGSVEAVAAIMPSAGQNVAAFNKNLSYIQNSAGLAKEASDKVSNSFEGQLKRSANEAQEALLSLGQGFIQVANPATKTAATVLHAFNSLPEPVKQTLGVTLGLAGGMLTLGGAIAGVTALTPIVTAGFTASAAALGLNSAAASANTAVTGASTAATAVFTAELSLSNLALVASTVQSTAAATARNVYAVATGNATAATLGFAGKLAVMAGQAALVGGAIYAVSEAFKRSEGAKFGQEVEDNTRKMLEFKASLEKGSSALAATTEKTASAASAFDVFGQVLTKSGAIEATRAGLAELDKAVGGTSDVTSTYGRTLAILTAQQRGNQIAMFALSDQIEKTGQTMNVTNDIITKYGLLTVDAGAKQRLGAEGIKKFKEEVSGQIQILNNYIDTLKSQKTPIVEQQQLINATIKNLESQSNSLKKRVYEVENDTQANKTNSQSLKDLILDVDSLGKAYEQSTKDIGLATEKRKAVINEQLAAGVISQEKANSESLQAEKQGLEDREKLIATEIPKLEAAKIGAKPEEIEKVNQKIQDLEGESANVRSQIALNLVSQKKAANAEALKDEEIITKTAAQNIINIEDKKATAIRELQFKGVISVQQASQQIDAIKIASTQREITAQEEELTRVTADRARNAITAQAFAEQEAAINSNVTKLKLKNIEEEIQAQENARERELKGIEKVNAQKLATVDNKASTANISIKQQQADGTIDAEAAAKKIFAVEQQAVKERLALANQEYVQVDYLEAKKLKTKEQAADLRTEIEKRVVALSLEQADKEVQARKDANDRILADLERSNRAAEASITISSNQRILIAKQAVLAAGATDKAQRESATQIAAINRQSATEQLQLLEKQVADVDRYEKQKVYSAQKAAEIRTGLEVQISQKNIELIDQQIAEVKRLQEVAIKAIQERADAEKHAQDQTLSFLEEEKAARNSILQTEQQDKDVLESRLNLQKAIAGIGDAKDSAKLASVNRALEARRKLDSDPSLGSGVTDVLNAQLKSAGFENSSEADILTQRRQMQTQIDKEKDAAAQREEKAARILLDIETSRGKLTSEIALLEAQISDSKATQAQLQAKANLEKAKLVGDPNEIADAEQQVKTADLSKEVAAKSIDAAQRGIEMQAELAENAQKVLVAQQEAAKVQREAAHAAQDQAAALEIAEARAKEMARIQKGDTRGPTSSSDAPDPNTEPLSPPTAPGLIPKPNTDPNYYNVGGDQQQPAAANFVVHQNNGLDDLAKWSNQASGATPDTMPSDTSNKANPNATNNTGAGGGSMESKLSNNPVVSELQKLNAKLTAIASRPTVLNVTTANPASDAATVYNNLSKNAVRNSNI